MLPLIIDTDPGVDDAVALLLALASPEVELRAVTTVFGNAPLATTTANAARILALAGRTDVPLGAGAAHPLVHPRPERVTARSGEARHGNDGLAGLAATLPAPSAVPDARGAVGLMAEVLRTTDEPVTVTAIGPLTNVALLLAVHPELTGRIRRIGTMGGSLGAGNTTEFNVSADPDAAHRVLTQANVPVTLVPLDLTLRCRTDAAWLDALASAGGRCALLAALVAQHRRPSHQRHPVDTVPLHDAVAVLEAIMPGTLCTTPLPIRVTCDLGPSRGTTVPLPCPASGSPVRTLDPASGSAVPMHVPGPPVHVALDADTGAVLTAILERLRRSD